MGWTSDEPQIQKKGMETSSKLLIAIIACVVLIIILILVLLMNMGTTATGYQILVNGVVNTTTTKEKLLTKIDDVTYINIEEFAKLVNYEYHQGEYKGYAVEQDKCYVQGKNETATFYLNEDKLFKLPVNKLNEQYQEYKLKEPIKSYNEKIYAPIEAISKAFNVQVKETESSLTIFTLEYLVTWYDAELKKPEWGTYTGLSNLSFENQKAILYDCFIVKKENGFYRVIDKNKNEILPDKYTQIDFVEATMEFFVTDSFGQVGIIDLEGEIVVEPVYKSITVLNKNLNLYLIQKDEKYGVVKSGNTIIINPEYDNIGLTFNSEKKNMIEDLIPACKNEKWGIFDTKGNLVYNIEYDNLGCNLTSIEFDGEKKTVNPVLNIKECNGIVVQKDNKYGILNEKGEILIPIRVDSIYSIENSQKEIEYFMIYNNKELNIIKVLIEQGLIEDPNKKEEISNTVANQNTVNEISQQTSNTIVNNVTE